MLYLFQIDPLATPTGSRNNTPTLGLQQQNNVALASYYIFTWYVKLDFEQMFNYSIGFIN